MKIKDLFEELKNMGEYSGDTTCDSCKCGDVEKEIGKIGVSMFATPEIIKECERKNISFLIVHEPVFYCHMDDRYANSTAIEKKKLCEDTGITIVRFHDFAHGMTPDLIYKGEMIRSGLVGREILLDTYAVNRFELTDPMTAKELAKELEKNLGIKHIRIAGETNKKGTKISCCFGTPGHVDDELDENDFVLTGEICEWGTGEHARDYAQFGYNKAILVLGHIGSEREGMRYLTEIIKSKHPEFDVEYLECGEVYSYTDSE